MNYLEEACFIHSPHDAELFARWTGDCPLPLSVETPQHCGPHSLRAMREIVRISQPKTMLEIGFCMGHSASIWLELGVELLVSVDISERTETKIAASMMEKKWGSRFMFRSRQWAEESVEMFTNSFDTVFIDGDHLEDGVMADIEMAQRVNAQWIAFDDFQKLWGPGVLPAIAKSRLVPVGIFGNMALCQERKWFA